MRGERAYTVQVRERKHTGRIAPHTKEERMNCSIVYSSRTGNTAQLANTLKDLVSQDNSCLYFGAPDARALQADLLFVGFWTDKGSCDQLLKDFLQTVHGKTVALFGTAGFGADPAYFERILGNVAACLPSDNRVLPGFMCQGRMPQAVRDRYEHQLEQNANDSMAKRMIENFDMALSHPSETDLQAMGSWLGSLPLA